MYEPNIFILDMHIVVSERLVAPDQGSWISWIHRGIFLISFISLVTILIFGFNQIYEEQTYFKYKCINWEERGRKRQVLVEIEVQESVNIGFKVKTSENSQIKNHRDTQKTSWVDVAD